MTTHSPDYSAVRHILESPSIGRRSARFIGEDAFDWAGLLAESETMSGGEAFLVHVAHDLWEGEGGVRLREIPRKLDEGNFRRVLHALAISRGGLEASYGVLRPLLDAS